jgi:hypothetical protein
MPVTAEAPRSAGCRGSLKAVLERATAQGCVMSMRLASSPTQGQFRGNSATNVVRLRPEGRVIVHIPLFG